MGFSFSTTLLKYGKVCAKKGSRTKIKTARTNRFLRGAQVPRIKIIYKVDIQHLQFRWQLAWLLYDSQGVDCTVFN